MPSYIIRWEIDIEADTPEEAARAARAMQLRPDTTATFFDVYVEDLKNPDDIALVASFDLLYLEA